MKKALLTGIAAALLWTNGCAQPCSADAACESEANWQRPHYLMAANAQNGETFAAWFHAWNSISIESSGSKNRGIKLVAGRLLLTDDSELDEKTFLTK